MSPTRLAAYEWCPASYRRRYVLGERSPITEAMAFGIAVHSGIEAAYWGYDGPAAFLGSWKAHRDELAEMGVVVDSRLSLRGIQLVEAVIALGLAGTPEVPCRVVVPGLDVALEGRSDLVDVDGAQIWDHKTTGYLGSFGFASVRAGRFQRLVYSLAFREQHGVLPRFEYLVLPRTGPVTVKRIEATVSEDDVTTILADIQAILTKIQDGEFPCTCGKCEVAA